MFVVSDSTGRNPGEYALKRLKNPNRIERFRLEAKALQALNHPGILTLVDSDLTGPSPYIVTPLFDSALTAAAISRLSTPERLSLILKVAEAVGAAHTIGIVHRDIKPDNVFLRSDSHEPVVGDWGLAILLDEGERLTATAEVVGSRYFAAPEFEDGFADAVGPPADVYALGKLLYWALTGRVFAREKHNLLPFDLRVSDRSTASYLAHQLFDRSITADPNARFENATAFASAIREQLALLRVGGRVLDRKAPRPCVYCGKGEYQIHVDTLDNIDRIPVALHNFGIAPTGAPRILILVCDHCGNCQIFRPDLTSALTNWT